MHYIGMDAHIATLEFAVINEKGKVIKQKTIFTGVKEFMQFVKSIPKPRKIIMEECNLANWALETCTRFKEELIISNPKTNKWIGNSGQKNDQIDAIKLGQLARGNYIKPIYHPIGNRRRFKELVVSYHDTVKNDCRIKNKLKAKFRENGIQCTGETIYDLKHRKHWKKQLPKNKILELIVEGLWNQLDQTQEVKNKLLEMIKIQGKQYSEIKKFKKIPGIGPIHASTISAIIETPHRFANKKKLWMYSGLGIIQRSSSSKIYFTKLTKEYNHLLKCSMKQATESAIKTKNNRYRNQYYNLLEKGIPSHRAKLTVARSLLTTVYAIWKNKEEYDPDITEKRLQKKYRVRKYYLTKTS